MQMYEGLQFFLILTMLLVPCVILGLSERSQEGWSFIASGIVLWMIYSAQKSAAIYLVIFTMWQWILLVIALHLNRNNKGSSMAWRAIVAGAILPVFLSKLAISIQTNWFLFAGISYTTFRVLQILIEVQDKIIEEVSLFDFLHFVFFFPTISAGPIDRSRRFRGDIKEVKSRDVYVAMLADGIKFLLLGVIYKMVLSSFLYEKMIIVSNERYTIWSLIQYMYLYGFYLFFDFAGYSLMAVGTGYIMGIKVPVNFDKPFLSVDIKDFWNRWHISLSQWFRDFVFSRYVMANIKRRGSKQRWGVAIPGYIINMTLMGIWHGFSLSYILYGIYHGLLLAGNEYYEKNFRFYKEHKMKKSYKICSWFITLNLVMFGFFVFSGKLEVILKILVGKLVA